MRLRRDLRAYLATSTFSLLCCVSTWAAAQQPAPPAAPPALGTQPPPPPGAQPPPPPPAAQPYPAPAQPYPPPGAQPYPGYAYPPPPPGYYPPPPGYYPSYYPAKPAPATLAYDGGPIPAGYHLEERARRGLVIAGPIMIGAPWMLGLLIASAANYSNSSGWLVVPVIGPWITLASRHRSHCTTNSVSVNTSGSVDDCIDSSADNSVQTLLVLDGLIQGAGAAMLIVGVASPKKMLIRDVGGGFKLTPTQIGRTGYGAVLSREF